MKNLHIISKMRSIVVIACIFTLLFQAKAQDTPTLTLKSGDVLIYSYNSDKLWLFDPQTGERTAYLDLEEPNADLGDILISNNKQSLYMVAFPHGQTPELIQVDLVDGEKQIVWSKKGLRQIFPYSDDNHLIIEYYDGKEVHITNPMDLSLCILDLSMGTCKDFTYEIKFVYLYTRRIQWVGDGKFISLGGSSLDFVDLNTQERRPLLGKEQFVMVGAPIPNTHKLVLIVAVGLGREDDLYTYDFDTSTVSKVNYTIDGSLEYYELQFSPDGRYLLRLKSASFPSPKQQVYDVIDFESGKNISDLSLIDHPIWLSENSLLGTLDENLDGRPEAIVRIDIETGMQKRLLDIDENVAFFYIP